MDLARFAGEDKLFTFCLLEGLSLTRNLGYRAAFGLPFAVSF